MPPAALDRWITLAEMRAGTGPRVVAFCDCGHTASLSVDHLPGTTSLGALQHRYRCTRCGARSSSVRPELPPMPGLASPMESPAREAPRRARAFGYE